MLRFTNNLLFFIVSLFPGEHTLRNRTWKKIERDHPSIYQISKEKKGYDLERRVNTFGFSVIAVILIISLCCFACNFSFDFSDTSLKWLNIISLNEGNANLVIAENLGVISSLVAISFVVIGFLFDIIRDKTQKTFEDLFRVTRLYRVFSIAIVSILTLVILNTLKHGLSINVLGNVAVLSTYLLMATIIAIAYLFYKVLQYFNPDKIDKLTKEYLLTEAKHRLVMEKFIKESRLVFIEIFSNANYKENSFSLFNEVEVQAISLANSDTCKFIDLYVPLLNFFLRKFRKTDTDGYEYIVLSSGNNIGKNHIQLYVPKELNLNKWLLKLFNLPFRLLPYESGKDDFDNEKNKLITRLNKAAEIGQTDMLTQQLSDISDLYDIYRNNR